MSRPTSFFLDLLRLAAAFAVFAYHCVLFWYPARAGGMVEELGHRAVIVFFVISGYVITYATLRRESDPRSYAVARLSRLYSVVLPALLLTWALQTAGTMLNPAFYAQQERGHDAARYFLTAFFLQSLWTLNGSPPTNGPFWSLGYEFWYYVIFGAAVFVKPRGWKIAAVLLLLGVSGINSFLLMPAWVLGVLLYLYGRKIALPRGWALAGAAAALAGTVLALLFLPDWPRHWGYPPFWHSSAFLSDGLLALLLAAVVGLADQAFRAGNVPERLDAVVRWAADHTFSLYLYHFPLVLFAAAAVPFDRSSPVQLAGIIAALLIVILLLSLVTESARGRWRKFFGCCWDFIFVRPARIK